MKFMKVGLKGRPKHRARQPHSAVLETAQFRDEDSGLGIHQLCY